MKSLKLIDFLWLFGLPTLLNYLASQVIIPELAANTQIPIEVIYFISVGGIVLMPMFFGAIYLTGKDIQSYKLRDVLDRMRIHKLTRSDWWWTVVTFLLVCLLSFVIAKLLMPEMGFDAAPFFFKNMPLDESTMWILYVWPLFFFFNVFGEEFYWRGYIMPRQELVNKKWTWLVHGNLWACWHIPMGFDLIFAALPILFILPAVVQVRKNTSISIIVHAVLGAFGFLAIALGGVH